MLVSMIVASGLYAAATIMPMLANSEPKHTSPVPPIVLVQSSGEDDPDTAQLTNGASEFVPFPSQAQFETGDTWVSGGRRYRLYGLQSCLRGTKVSLSASVVRDCGELNLIMAQAVIKDTRPVCALIKNLDQNNAVVACQTTSGQHHYDLATYLIANGWGFAAVDASGQLIVPGYRAAEETARAARAGLWAYPDLTHPVSVLNQQAGSAR